MTYEKKKIFTADDLRVIKELSDSLEFETWHQHYNLFDTSRAHIPTKYWSEEPFIKLEEYVGKKAYTHYFLKYEVGSFARMHKDNVDKVGQTIVTHIDSSPDLHGGDSVIFGRYAKKVRPSHLPAKRVKGEKGQYNEQIIPITIRAENGESIVYDTSMQHGVSLVERGIRIVLISWFQK